MAAVNDHGDRIAVLAKHITVIIGIPAPQRLPCFLFLDYHVTLHTHSVSHKRTQA